MEKKHPQKIHAWKLRFYNRINMDMAQEHGFKKKCFEKKRSKTALRKEEF